MDRRQAFRLAAERLDATFLPGKRTLADEVHLKHGPWQLILDTYVESNGQTSVTYTRARALYVAKEDFTFRIWRRNVFTRIAEAFGSRGLLVGDQELEGKYTIKSSSVPRGRSLMTDRRLRELIVAQPSLRLEIRRQSWSQSRKTGQGVRTVEVRTTGVIKEPDRLADYVRLVANVLEQLVRIGGGTRGCRRGRTGLRISSARVALFEPAALWSTPRRPRVVRFHPLHHSVIGREPGCVDRYICTYNILCITTPKQIADIEAVQHPRAAELLLHPLRQDDPARGRRTGVCGRDRAAHGSSGPEGELSRSCARRCGAAGSGG